MPIKKTLPGVKHVVKVVLDRTGEVTVQNKYQTIMFQRLAAKGPEKKLKLEVGKVYYFEAYIESDDITTHYGRAVKADW